MSVLDGEVGLYKIHGAAVNLATDGRFKVA